MPANDMAGKGAGDPTPTGQMDFTQPKPGEQAQKYDADGYPLPNADQIKAAQYAYSFDAKDQRSATGTVAYDPSMAPPSPDSDNPFQPGSSQALAWVNHNAKKKQNQANKEAWQKQHESLKQPAAPAAAAQSSAPATPFQSSGIDLTQQGKGESYIDSILSHYQEAGVPQVGNQSQQTLDEFRRSQPADMSPYYDQASKLASAKIDNAMSARGSYGSSNATGQIGAAEVALRAQQARDNASYGLSRFAQEGSLSGAADNQQNVGNGIQFQWTKGLADLAGKDQQLGQDRNQQLWGNNFSLAAAKAGIYGAGATGAISDVSAATDAANNAKMGVASDALSNANSDANASNSATKGLLEAANQGVSNYTKYNSGKTN